jgi:alkanesulfonate monooxygenase SsuD/methylene tetrahydromethanopterin reductase-like flavin-dependent oxidoreductase (luciferase family)
MAATWSRSPWVEQHQDGVGFAIQAFPNDTPTDKARHLLAAGRLAEALGFDGFFLGDHPGWMLDPWPHLGALAVTTERIRLGINVACALYRHPVLTARLAADVDNLSGGRVVLGLGCGWDGDEFAKLGQPFPPVAERQDALDEAVAIIRGVWGDAPFSFEGHHFRCGGAQVRPAPLQRPGPPLMIAGAGRRTLRQVAESAEACNLFQLDRYFPEGLERRYSGPWHDFVMAATPERAVAHFGALVEAGVQYVIVETLDAADQETMRLLAERVVPRLRG